MHGESVGVEYREYDGEQDHDDHSYRNDPFDRELLLLAEGASFRVTEAGLFFVGVLLPPLLSSTLRAPLYVVPVRFLHPVLHPWNSFEGMLVRDLLLLRFLLTEPPVTPRSSSSSGNFLRARSSLRFCFFKSFFSFLAFLSFKRLSCSCFAFFSSRASCSGSLNLMIFSSSAKRLPFSSIFSPDSGLLLTDITDKILCSNTIRMKARSDPRAYGSPPR